MTDGSTWRLARRPDRWVMGMFIPNHVMIDGSTWCSARRLDLCAPRALGSFSGVLLGLQPLSQAGFGLLLKRAPRAPASFLGGLRAPPQACSQGSRLLLRRAPRAPASFSGGLRAPPQAVSTDGEKQSNQERLEENKSIEQLEEKDDPLKDLKDKIGIVVQDWFQEMIDKIEDFVKESLDDGEGDEEYICIYEEEYCLLSAYLVTRRLFRWIWVYTFTRCEHTVHQFKGKVPSVKAIDTTGAGDAFVGRILNNLAFDFYLHEDGEWLREALLFANACGALTVTKKGAIPALPTKDSSSVESLR
ncbi:hypothetical protein Vadar_007431 [Vaccinium darrowii]|uniref:Uncharacterized protein n=1 Tax=Vaccinium darrowii TaxID=229202 RepID=A0ACB7YL32_9ERIC|nr:hypothetical protein Vadar_007431 [Vaccinium darrowii]